ncbi:MAG: metallophosphoesterase family protein [Thermodesulfobacteriota bacterium]
MKLLTFSDVHCSEKHCTELVKMSVSVDMVIAAGDLALVRKNLGETIRILAAIQKPTVLVPGNSESLEELLEACSGWTNAHVLHGSGIELMGRSFFGIGGGIPVTPFGSWSYDFTEDEATQLLSTCPRNAILVTHSPPKGVVDVSSGGQHFGSLAIRQAILDKSPLLCVCGHIHESAGKCERLGDTPVINAGPKGFIHEIPD